jgi:hypothetical protein
MATKRERGTPEAMAGERVDGELEIMRTIATALDRLPDRLARIRVLRWALAREAPEVSERPSAVHVPVEPEAPHDDLIGDLKEFL